MHSPFRHRLSNRKGASTVILCLMLPAILMVSAFAINVVHMEHVRTDLQITTDVATRAAGRMLAVTGSKETAIRTAEELLNRNPIMNHTVTLDEVDIEFGASTRSSDRERYSFQPNAENPNAVRVVGNGRLRLEPLFPTLGVSVKVRPVKAAISTQTELDVALVMDRSGSMAFAANEKSGGQLPPSAPPGWALGQPVPAKSRWQDASVAVDLFLHLLAESSHNEFVGLCTYSDNSKIENSLSNVYEDINQSMNLISQKYDGGRTNIGDGIRDGIAVLADKRFARPWANRVIILMTDGIHNTGSDPVQAAKLAATEEIQIYTISFSNEADIARMDEIAKIGSGKHFHAQTAEELRQAFIDIAKSLPTLLTH